MTSTIPLLRPPARPRASAVPTPTSKAGAAEFKTLTATRPRPMCLQTERVMAIYPITLFAIAECAMSGGGRQTQPVGHHSHHR